MIALAIIISATILIGIIFGLTVYFLLGSWIAALICFLGCVITVSVVIGIVKIVDRIKESK